MSQRVQHVLLTLLKELRETIRDRRTIGVMVLFPLVVYPALSLLVTQVVATRSREAAARPSAVAVEGPERAVAPLRARLAADPKAFRLVAGGPQDVEAGRVDALVRVSEPGPGKPARAEIVFDGTSEPSQKAEGRLGDELSCALPAGTTPLFSVARRDLATKDQIGGYVLSKALPLVLVLMVLLGAFYPAIDVTAGERERGTLETTLAAPIRRTDLLLGKVLAVAALATLTGLLNLVSMSLTLVQVVRLAEPGAALPIPWGRAAATGIVILPCAFLFGALFVTIGSLARGFKEAQNLLLPAYFLFFTPAIVGTLGEMPLSGIAAFVPGMNVTLLARDVALGRASPLAALATVGSTVVYGLLSLSLAARLYTSERFVDGGLPRRRGAGATAGRREPPTAGEALTLFAVAYLLLYFVFIPLQHKRLVPGLLLSQWVGMLGLVLAFARATGRSARDALALHRPRAAALVGGVLIGACAWIIAGLVTEWVAPPPKEMIEQLRKTVVGAAGERGIAATLFLFAVTPAICEEALFRGPILRGLLGRLPPAAAIALVALFFGLFHIDVYRLLPTGLLGLALGFVAWRSGSLVPAMALHFTNNAALVLLARAGLESKLAALGTGAKAALFTAAVLGTAGGIALVIRGGTPKGRDGGTGEL